MEGKSEFLQIRVTGRQKAAIKRLARATGLTVSSYVLSRALPEVHTRFTELVGKLGRGDDHRFVLAELNDLLTSLAPMEFGDAVARAPLAGLSPFEKNYIAALVDQAAALKGVDPPAWVRETPPLEVPYFATTMASLRLHLLGTAPVAFKRRNLFVDTAIGGRV